MTIGASRGFTLIELMVSISIVTVMLGVGIPAFQDYGRKAELKQAATDIQVALMQAHSLALAPEADKPSNITFYGVEFDPAAASFDVVRGQPAVGVCPLGLKTVLEHHTVPSSISISPSTNCIGYLVGTGAEPLFAGTGSATIGLNSSRINGTTVTVGVNRVTGQITVE